MKGSSSISPNLARIDGKFARAAVLRLSRQSNRPTELTRKASDFSGVWRQHFAGEKALTNNHTATTASALRLRAPFEHCWPGHSTQSITYIGLSC